MVATEPRIAQGLCYIELPSGGEWVLYADPPWGVTKAITEGIDPSELLAKLSKGWTFGEDLTAENIDKRATSDIIAVMEVLNTHLLPLLAGSAKTS